MGSSKSLEFGNVHLGVRHQGDRRGGHVALMHFPRVCCSFYWNPERIQHISEIFRSLGLLFPSFSNRKTASQGGGRACLKS